MNTFLLSLTLLISTSVLGATNPCTRISEPYLKRACNFKISEEHFDEEALKICDQMGTNNGTAVCLDTVSGKTYQPGVFDTCTSLSYFEETVTIRGGSDGSVMSRGKELNKTFTDALWLKCLGEIADKTFDVAKLNRCTINSEADLENCLKSAKTTAKPQEGCTYADETPQIISGPTCGTKDSKLCVAKASCQTKEYGVVETTLTCTAVNGTCPTDASACAKDKQTIASVETPKPAAATSTQETKSKSKAGTR